MKTILVMLSTYNGAKYLDEQLESIIAQIKDKFTIDILVRDDGSTDNTKQKLNEYQAQGILKWYTGENLKPAKSFMNLLAQESKYDYYAFCDQDDYWHPPKILEAFKQLEMIEDDNGKLYISTLNIVDENLKLIKQSVFFEQNNIYSSMIRNQATGCTMVMDNKLRNIIVDNQSNYISMHDSWIYRLSLYIDASIILDKNSYIGYRQHGNNVIGMNDNIINKSIKCLLSFFKSENESSRTAKELLSINVKTTNKQAKEYIEYLSNYRSNIKSKLIILFTNKFKSKSIISTILFKIKIIFNKA